MAESDRFPTTALPDVETSEAPAIQTSAQTDSLPSAFRSSHSSNTVCPPQLISPRERLAWEEFISGVGPLTQIVYARAVRRFLEQLVMCGLAAGTVTPAVVRDYLDALHTRPGHRQRRPSRASSIRTRKQHLAAIRHFYHHMVQRHAAVINPAAGVRSPRLSIERGETVAILPEQVRQTLGAIDTRTFIGHRDHTLILTLALTAARVGAIAGLRRGSVIMTMSSGHPVDEFLILREKNDKRRRLPMPGELRDALRAWLQRLGPGDTREPVFPSTRNNRPTERPFSSQDIRRMVRRRFRAAGVTIPGLTCHGFRAGAATVLLGAGMELTRVQDLLGHADPRTTRLYDARSREAQMDILSRLSTLLTSPRCAPAPSDGDPSLDRE